MPRKFLIKRKTKETEIEVNLNIDGKGRPKISGPVHDKRFIISKLDKL